MRAEEREEPLWPVLKTAPHRDITSTDDRTTIVRVFLVGSLLDATDRRLLLLFVGVGV